MFEKTVKQFDGMLKRKAFIDQYLKEPMFEKDLGEFESAR